MSKKHRFDHAPYLAPPDVRVYLQSRSTSADEISKAEAKRSLSEDVEALSAAQEMLWATGKFAVLIILQGMDASGKDGVIKHVMSGVNPQGCSVHSFRAPNEEELQHDFLWRPTRYLPGKGRIAIFNRSYYEEVLVVRVHPAFLQPQKLPDADSPDQLWQRRFAEINAFEQHLTSNSTVVLKFFLHLSKKEQKERFLDRLDHREKHWKFNEADLRERAFWDEYRHAYEEMLARTSTAWAPWHIVPADDKWFARALVADVIAARIEALDLAPPVLTDEQRKRLKKAREELVNE